MAKTLEGVVVFAIIEKDDVFHYTDPKTGQVRPLRSLKVLLSHGDGTITRESISVPPGYEPGQIEFGSPYGLPCIATVSRKSGKLNFTLRQDLKPFAAPTM